MKMFRIILPVVVIMLFASCETITENLNARSRLAKCKYEVTSVKITGVKLKNMKLSSLETDVVVRVTNTTDGEVAMDHVKGHIYLDNNRTTDLEHKKFVRIPAKSSSSLTVDVSVPLEGALKGLSSKPEKIIVEAVVYMNLIVGGTTLGMPVGIKVRQEFPIPYDTIAYLAKRELRRMGQRGIQNIFQ
jgi:LEA14-like dessication related protein